MRQCILRTMANRDSMQEENKLTEKQVEAYLKKRVESLRGECVKMGTVHRIGFPDRLICLPGGRAFFVETKKTGGKLDPAQIIWFNRLRALGMACHVVDSYASIDLLLVIKTMNHAK